jgi:hypothetical protein
MSDEDRVPTRSHSEASILAECINMMQSLVEDFAEWYKWYEGEDKYNDIPEDERFEVRMHYTTIVQQLFLQRTHWSGGASTRAKCEELNVDPSESVVFGWDLEDEEYEE